MGRRDPRAEVRLTSDVDADSWAADDAPDPDRKFLILVLGDFRGTANAPAMHGEDNLGERTPLRVDRDDFDLLLRRLNVRWQGRLIDTPAGGLPVSLNLCELEDFHPDRIVQSIPALKELQAMLRALEGSSGMDEAESCLRRWGILSESSARDEQAAAAPSVPPAEAGSARLLDAIIDQEKKVAPAPPVADRELQQFVQRVVEPHRIRDETARRESLAGALNRLLSEQVSRLLHQPEFQVFEARWRGLFWLVRQVETGPHLEIRVLQLGKEEILRDLGSGRSWEDSELARLLVDPAGLTGAGRPALILGDYFFSSQLEDLAVLERVGHVAARLRAPFIAAAAPGMFGRENFDSLEAAVDLRRRFEGEAYDSWNLLRRSAVAPWLTLALPRILCRLPYGKDWDPAESFAFEEDLAAQRHRNLLWGNPAYLVGAVYAAGFSDYGWEMRLAGSVPRVDGLPLFVSRKNGEPYAQPCAEALIGDRTAAALMEAGFLPLLSHRDSDAVSLPSLQNISDPPSAIRR